MSNPKKPINEVDIFSSLSVTAKRIISQLLESNEKLQQENQELLHNITNQIVDKTNNNIPKQVIVDSNLKISQIKKNIFGNLIFHYGSILLSLVSGVILVPMYLKFIPVDVYSVWLASGNIFTLLSIIDPGLASVIQQQVAEKYGQSKFDEVHQLIIGGLLISFMLTLLCVIIGVTLSYLLPFFITLPIDIDINLIQRSCALAAVGVSISFSSFAVTGINFGLQNANSVSKIYLAINAIGIILTVLLLNFKMGLISLPIASIFRSIGWLLFNFISLKEMDTYKTNIYRTITWNDTLQGARKLSKIFSYSLVGRLSKILTGNFDALIAAKLVGIESVSVMVLTSRGPETVRPFIERFSISFMSSISHVMGTGDMPKIKQILLRILAISSWALFLAVGASITFNKYFVELWVGQQLYAGNLVNLLLCFNMFLSVLVSVIGSICFSLGNIKKTSIVSFLQGFLYIAFASLGASQFGLIGIVAGSLCSSLLTSSWYLPKELMRIVNFSRTEVLKIIKNIVCPLLSAWVCTLIFQANILDRIVDWKTFVCYSLYYSAIYSLILFLITEDFRLEIKLALAYGRSRLVKRK
jgi:O-antigen/teichoic acid export membrane protein